MKNEIIQSESVRYERRTELTAHSGQALLFEQFTILKRTWYWMLIIAIVAAAGVAYYVTNYIPVEYKATLVALPPNKSGTPLDNVAGGISSTLKDFGLSKLAGKASSDNGYSRAVLLSSHALMDSLIAKHKLFSVYKPAISPDRRDMMYAKLAENIEIDISLDGPITVGVYDVDTARAVAMATDIIEFTNAISRELNMRETDPITSYMGDMLARKREMQDSLGKKLSVYMAQNKIYDAESQAGAAGAEIMRAETNVAAQRTTVKLLTDMLGAEDPKTMQAKEILRGYEAQSRSMAAGRGGAIGTLGLKQLPAAMVNYIQLRQDYEVNQKVLAWMEPIYEQTRYDAIKNIPVLNILDKPYAPPVKARPKRLIVILSAFLGTFIIGYVVIAIAAYVRHFLQRYRAYQTDVAPAQQRIGSAAVPKSVGELPDSGK